MAIVWLACKLHGNSGLELRTLSRENWAKQVTKPSPNSLTSPAILISWYLRCLQNGKSAIDLRNWWLSSHSWRWEAGKLAPGWLHSKLALLPQSAIQTRMGDQGRSPKLLYMDLLLPQLLSQAALLNLGNTWKIKTNMLLRWAHLDSLLKTLGRCRTLLPHSPLKNNQWWMLRIYLGFHTWFLILPIELCPFPIGCRRLLHGAFLSLSFNCWWFCFLVLSWFITTILSMEPEQCPFKPVLFYFDILLDARKSCDVYLCNSNHFTLSAFHCYLLTSASTLYLVVLILLYSVFQKFWRSQLPS